LLDEAHRVLAQLLELAVRELLREQVRLEHVALPRHPDERDAPALVERAEAQRIDVQQIDDGARLQLELSERRVDLDASHAVAEDVVVVARAPSTLTEHVTSHETTRWRRSCLGNSRKRCALRSTAVV
jgi:hypothetical protein